MRVIIQRVHASSIKVENQVISEIGHGLNLLVCIEKTDTEKTLEKAAQKILNLRIFTDPQSEKMKLNIKDINGEILAISQFTLSWKGEKGNRPSFDRSMEADNAKEMFEFFCRTLKSSYRKVYTGVFGEKMRVAIENDGPVSFCLDF